MEQMEQADTDEIGVFEHLVLGAAVAFVMTFAAMMGYVVGMAWVLASGFLTVLLWCGVIVYDLQREDHAE